MKSQLSELSKALKVAFEHNQSGNLKGAENICHQILLADPQNAGAHYLLGLIANQTGQIDKAIKFFEKTIQYNMNNAWAHIALGNALKSSGKMHRAVSSYKKAISLNPNLAEASFNLGNAYQVMGLHEDAASSYQNAIKLKPDFAAAYNNLGNTLKKLGLVNEATASYEKAVFLEPDNASMQNNLGCALSLQGRLSLAVACYRRAISIKPDYAEAYNHLGEALLSMGHISEAAVNINKSLTIKPDFIDALINLGNTYIEQGNLHEAVSCFQKVFVIDPGNHTAHSNLLLALNYLPNFSQEEIFKESVKFGDKYSKESPSKSVHPRNNNLNKRRLRIGYISPDFRKHSVAYFIEPLLKWHNSKKFEVYCYSDVKKADDITERLQSYVPHWLSIYGKNNDDVERRIRDDQIDILIDLAGHTANNRLLIFAKKPAPIQITWLGYPNTTGIHAIDYRLTDIIADPFDEADEFHTEKLIRLANGFLCYQADEHAPALSKLPYREKDYITFGSFNNLTKTTAEVVRIWSKILHSVSNAHLLLKSKPLADSQIRAKYLKMFAEEGISADRIELSGMLAQSEDHLKLYNKVDIALDPFPYNGTTTTCEALWMGVPVITLCGDRHAGRVGASIINQIGLQKILIANSITQYIQIATDLALDVAGLSQLRNTLRLSMMNSSLCDAKAFADKLEGVLLEVWDQYLAGEIAVQ